MKEIINREICYKCYRPKSSCVCEYIKSQIETKTKFVILMHPKEFRKTKNGTGHMTNNSLSNSQIFIGIDFSNHKEINELINDKNNEAYLLYPNDNSIKLNTQSIQNKKTNIIFILDSTWACSKKMLKLSKNLQKLKTLSFDYDKSSQFKFKTQPNKYCLSTIESTLCVLKELNNHKIEDINKSQLDSFLSPFEEMVKFQVSCNNK